MHSITAKLLILSVLVWHFPLTLVHATSQGEAAMHGPSRTGASSCMVADLPADARAAISSQLGATRYGIKASGEKIPGANDVHWASNHQQDVRVEFSDQGFALRPLGDKAGDWHLEMGLAGYGREGDHKLKKPVSSSPALVDGNHVQYRRGELREWYVNDATGFEHGITLLSRPSGPDNRQLRVEWALSGTLLPRMEEAGQAIVFDGGKNRSVLRYAGLKAWDATGRPLAARLELRTGSADEGLPRIAFLVDDCGARYPVTIDPMFTQVKKLTAPDGEADDHFGLVVAVSGDTIVIGARDDDDNGSNSGSAYVFGRNQGGSGNWGLVKKILPLDGAADDNFSYSVAVSGDTIVIGARGDDDLGLAAGAAYVFTRNHGGNNNWGQVKKLFASDAQAGDNFGYSVAVSGDTIVVATPWDDNENGSSVGAAYIYSRDQGGENQWGEVRKIISPDGVVSEHFGGAIALSGDTLVVGDMDADSAYIFVRIEGGPDNWGQVAKLTAADGVAGDWWDGSVAISGDTVVIGAQWDNGVIHTNYPAVGSAYIFSRDQGGSEAWGQLKKIYAEDGYIDDHFGKSVAVSGDLVAVGAYMDDDNGHSSGSIYLFGRNEGGADNWGFVQKILADESTADEYLGRCIALDDGTLVAGTYEDDDHASNAGAAYIFNVTTLAEDTTPDAFSFTAQTDAALSSVATSNTITVSGINSASPISIVGGTYSINGGGYTADAGTVNNGDTVNVQQTASGSYSTMTTATLTIGGVGGAFNVTTIAEPATTPTVTTAAPSSVTSTAATGGGNVTSDGGAEVTVRGVCWNTTGNPTLANSKTMDGGGTGPFSSSITDLTADTTYYVRAYATNGEGTAYGSEVSFTTDYAAVFYVCTDGICGGNNPCYTTIQAAINEAVTGTAIRIAQETFPESITLNASKKVTLQGGWNTSFKTQTPNTTFIKAPKAPQGKLVLQMLTIKP